MSKYLIYSLLWSITGDSRLKVRQELGDYLRGITTTPLPPPSGLIIDYEVSASVTWSVGLKSSRFCFCHAFVLIVVSYALRLIYFHSSYSFLFLFLKLANLFSCQFCEYFSLFCYCLSQCSTSLSPFSPCNNCRLSNLSHMFGPNCHVSFFFDAISDN